jgi:hypothetical protein
MVYYKGLKVVAVQANQDGQKNVIKAADGSKLKELDTSNVKIGVCGVTC